MASETSRGKAWARALSTCSIGLLADSLVLGDFDWRDWFEDKPSREFLRAATNEAMQIEQEYV